VKGSDRSSSRLSMSYHMIHISWIPNKISCSSFMLMSTMDVKQSVDIRGQDCRKFSFSTLDTL